MGGEGAAGCWNSWGISSFLWLSKSLTPQAEIKRPRDPVVRLSCCALSEPAGHSWAEAVCPERADP